MSLKIRSVCSLSALIGVIMLGIGCSEPQVTRPTEPSMASKPLESATLVGEWIVQVIEDAPTIGSERTVVTMTFDASGKVFGSTGVNRMNGGWALNEGGLTFSRMITTRRAGPPELMEQEQRFCGVLDRVRGAQIDAEGRLVMSSDDGTDLIVAMRPPK